MNSLTHSLFREKLMVTQIVKKFPALYGTPVHKAHYPIPSVTFRNKLVLYGGELFAPRPTPQAVGCELSDDC